MTSPIAGNEGFIAISNISAPVNNISVGGAASVQEVDISGAFNSAFDGVGLGVVKEVIGYAPTSFSSFAVQASSTTATAADALWLNNKKGLAAATSTSDSQLLKLPRGARVISAHITNNGTLITPSNVSLESALGQGPGNIPIVAGDNVITSNSVVGVSGGQGINAFFGAVVGGPTLGDPELGDAGNPPNPLGGAAIGIDATLGITNDYYVSLLNQALYESFDYGTIQLGYNTEATTATNGSADLFDSNTGGAVAISGGAGGGETVTATLAQLVTDGGSWSGQDPAVAAITFTLINSDATTLVSMAPNGVAGASVCVGDTLVIPAGTTLTTSGTNYDIAAAGGDLVFVFSATSGVSATDAAAPIFYQLVPIDLNEDLIDDALHPSANISVSLSGVVLTTSDFTATITTGGVAGQTPGSDVATNPFTLILASDSGTGTITSAVVQSSPTGFKYGDTIIVAAADLVTAGFTGANENLTIRLTSANNHLTFQTPTTSAGGNLAARGLETADETAVATATVASVTALTGEISPTLVTGTITGTVDKVANNCTYDYSGNAGADVTAGDLAMKIKYLL